MPQSRDPRVEIQRRVLDDLAGEIRRSRLARLFKKNEGPAADSAPEANPPPAEGNAHTTGS